jgi:KDO2-lipid IV(A) lauroyltransferase
MSDEAKSKLVCWLEYALMRGYFAFISILPERAAAWVGIGLSNLIWLFKRGRRRTAAQQIERAMPGRFSPAEIRRIVRRAFIHIGLAVTETAWFSRRPPEAVSERFEIEGIEKGVAAHARGRGLIAATGHFGNWELFGGALAQRGGEFTAFARPSKNPLIERYVTHLRGRLGISILETTGGARGVVRVLREGRALSVMVDRHARDSGVVVDFFGRPCWTTAVVATLGARLKSPIIVAYSLRQDFRFRHRGRVIGPLELVDTGDRDADARTNTQRINDILEEIIREHPEQWGRWMYKRWRDTGDRGTAAEEGEKPTAC